MNATKFIVAAGLAIATTGAFAETGVGTFQIDNVANVYGRAGVPNVRIVGAVATQPADVAHAGRDSAKGDTKIAVGSNQSTVAYGRS